MVDVDIDCTVTFNSYGYFFSVINCNKHRPFTYRPGYSIPKTFMAGLANVIIMI